MKPKSHKITHLSCETLNQLIKDPDSFVELITSPYEIPMEPYHYSDRMGSIKSILQSNVGQYSPFFKGILLGFQNVVLLTRTAMIFGSLPTSYNCVQADFFVFKPVLGAVLKGVVNVSKKGADHIGCLVHQTFNVTIPKPEDDDEWIGSSVRSGAEVSFEITKTDFNRKLPYIRGVLRDVLSEPDSGLGTNSDEAEHSQQSPKKKRKKHDDSFAVLKSPSPKKSARVSFSEPLEAASTPTTSKGKKRKHANSSTSDVDDDFQPASPKKKKIKREKVSNESDHGDGSFTKKKNIKKEKLSEDSDNGSLTDLDLGSVFKSGRVDLKRESLGTFTDMASKGKARRRMSVGEDITIERCSQFELPDDSELEAIIKTEDGRKKKKVKKRDTL